MKLKLIYLTLIFGLSVFGYGQEKLLILHTNDTHSQIEVQPSSNKRYPGKGGVLNRLAIIDSIRKTNQNVLLIDAGDFVQGSPYYNLFKGRIEAEAMNMMGYDVGVLGNHEFDYGLDTLKMVIEKLNYPIICTNYDFSKTVLNKKTEPYIIIKKGELKIGIIGIGVDPKGLIPESKYQGMIFRPIISTANKYAKQLKSKDKCDLVICVSHIGYNQDVELAKYSKNIDIIIGGHSHTYLEKGEKYQNLNKKEIQIFQTGSQGVNIGKIEIEFTKTR